MKRFALVVALLVVVLGCGGSERPPAQPATIPPQPVASPAAAPAPEAPPALPAPPARSVDALPPPKPTTIPLGKTGDASLDTALAAADKAFEAGDLDLALTGYDAARKAAPKRAAPI